MRKILFALLFSTSIGLFLLCNNVFALPVLYPDNGHYYEVVDPAVNWNEAKALAEGSYYLGTQGHLATLTSQAENDWVWGNLGNPYPYGYFLGGFQNDGTGEPNEGWQWVTGEPWDYTNWVEGEPNNFDWDGEEDALSFWSDGTWNDISKTGYSGYIVEYPVPEPASVSLLGVGLLGAVAVFRRRK